jgi:WD40 repeat protein
MIKIARQEDAAPKFFYITFFSFFHRNIQFSPDISKFAYGNNDGLIYVWNLDKSTGKWKEEYKLDSQTKHRIYTLSFFPDNVQLLAGCLSKI